MSGAYACHDDAAGFFVRVTTINGETFSTNLSPIAVGADLWRLVVQKFAFNTTGKFPVLVFGKARLALQAGLAEQGVKSGDMLTLVCREVTPVEIEYILRKLMDDLGLEDVEELAFKSITRLTDVKSKLLHAFVKHDWPVALQYLTFGREFNEVMTQVTLPAGLHSLTFGRQFNQDMTRVTLPAGLQSLTFGYSFNQDMTHVALPVGLQSLTFGWLFNQDMTHVALPAGLQSLTFGYSFNQDMTQVTLPAGLQSLTFGVEFNQDMTQVTLPAGLQSLTFGYRFNQDMTQVTLPAGLQSLTFDVCFKQDMTQVTLPAGLQSLTFGFFNNSTRLCQDRVAAASLEVSSQSEQ